LTLVEAGNPFDMKINLYRASSEIKQWEKTPAKGGGTYESPIIK